MNTSSSSTPSSNSRSRALVLAGAGAAGNAWQVGLTAGLAEAGVDLTAADLVIGTSAGSTGAAQLTSGIRPAELYAAILSQVIPPRPPGAPSEPPRGQGPAKSASYLAWSNQVIADSTDLPDWRRRMAAAALEKDAVEDTGSARWRATVAARFPSAEWPERRVLIAALDARTAEPVVFDRDSGIDLVDAVAASTSNGFDGSYRIGENRYLNGAYRRSSNADLATGYERVLILDPFGGRSRTPLEWGMDLATQVAELRASGSRVETVFPDAGAGDVFNENALDPSTRRQAALGGHQQGRALAPQLAGFWSA